MNSPKSFPTPPSQMVAPSALATLIRSRREHFQKLLFHQGEDHLPDLPSKPFCQKIRPKQRFLFFNRRCRLLSHRRIPPRLWPSQRPGCGTPRKYAYSISTTSGTRPTPISRITDDLFFTEHVVRRDSNHRHIHTAPSFKRHRTAPACDDRVSLWAKSVKQAHNPSRLYCALSPSRTRSLARPSKIFTRFLY